MFLVVGKNKPIAKAHIVSFENYTQGGYSEPVIKFLTTAEPIYWHFDNIEQRDYVFNWLKQRLGTLSISLPGDPISD